MVKIRSDAFVRALLLCLAFVAGTVRAAEPVCAVVKIEIKQELTLERQAFDATMRINNGLDTLSLENVAINVTFGDENGNTVLATSDPNDTAASFYIRVDSLNGIADINGAGVVPPQGTAEVHWLIIPAPGAAGNVPSGKLYFVGASLDYTLGGEPKNTTVTPDSIYVKPLPLLTLDYFLTKEVYADDAFTPEVEPAEPFTLGVRVSNNGAATARAVKIDSAQPTIVENEQGLLIGFTLIGSQVNDQPASNSLLVNLGDIPAGGASIGRWDMVTTLSGQFTDFEASFSHADELGGQLTSILQATNAHFLLRNVLVDVPGRDTIHDFLGYPASGSGAALTVYESDNVDTPVTDQSASSTLTALNSGATVTHTLTMPVTAGFVYVKLPDPYGGKKEIKQVVRSDGKTISLANAWTSRTRNRNTNPPGWNYWINLFDANTTGTYSIMMGPPDIGPTPPEFTPLNNVTTFETNPTTFPVAATDPNGDTVSLTATGLPNGASFVDNGNGSGTFTWVPAVGQAGRYAVTFTATDNGGLSRSQTVTIQVNPQWDTDGDGMDDQWEIDNFGDLSRDGSGDFDGDGISDLQEYLDGTDPTVAAITGDWSAPADVETNNAGSAVKPVVAMAPDGSALAVWAQSDGARTSIWANRYVPGTGWGTPALVEQDDTGDAHSPQVAFDASGNAMAIWLQSDGTRDNLWSNTWQPASGWGTPVLVEQMDSGDAADARLAVLPDGGFIAVWAQADGTPDANNVIHPNTVMSNRYAPASGWETASRIDSDTAIHTPGIAVVTDASGNALAVWSSTAEGVTYNLVARRYLATGGWQASEIVRAGAFGQSTDDQVTARLAMNADGATVLAWSEAASPASVWATTFTPDGGWGTAQVIENATPAAIQPAVAIDRNGNAILVFAQSDGTRYSIRANRFTAGSGWGSATLIGTTRNDPVNGDAALPQVAFDVAGNVLAVWQQSDGIQHNIWARRFVARDNAWADAAIIETENLGDALNPQLALARDGSAVVVWQQANASRSRIQANTYEQDNTGVPNIMPIVQTADTLSVDEQTSVTLDGAASFDQDGTLASYQWTQISGEPVTLASPNTAVAGFAAPTLTTPAVLGFRLTVTDDAGASASRDVQVTVNPVNLPPTASAGPDQSVDEQTTVTLTGSGTDSDGSIAAYQWTQISGAPVTLTTPGSPTTTFVAPVTLVGNGPQTLAFRLTVTDNEGASASDEILITVNPVNLPPVAQAGVDQTVDEQTSVSLIGGATDSDGTIASYQWVQTAGIPVTLSGADSATATFTAPVVRVQDGPQTLTFRLTATDNEGASAADEISLTVNPVNALPVVDAGDHRAVFEQTAVTLQGSATDSDGTITAYQWTQIAGPTVTPTGADTATPGFTTPVVLVQDSPTLLTFRLTVTDDEGGVASNTVTLGVMAQNASPVADAGSDITVDELLPVTLTGNATDSDGTITAYAWTQISGPTVTLSGATSASAGFTAPRLKQTAVLTFRLTVTDNETAMASDEVQVIVNPVNTPPLVNTGADQTVDETTVAMLDGSATVDPDADGVLVSYQWTQTSGPAVALYNANSVQASFTAPSVYQDTPLTFSLTVTDDEGGVGSASTRVTVQSVNPDDDGDGLLDLWEIRYFNTLDRDGSGDFDNDGATDLQEHGFGTDPTQAQMPAQPDIVSPDGVEVTVLQPELVLTNPDQHPGFPVVYHYEVYRDAAMTQLISSDMNGGLRWTVPVALDDNTRYYWRARAANAVLSSGWVRGRFFVNTVNDAPGAFNISYPQDGTWVNSFTPQLSVTNSVDVDEDALTYRFEVYAGEDLSQPPVASGEGILPGLAGTTAWQVDTPLQENHWYTWRAIVTDEHGASMVSPTSRIFVNTVNDPPAVPVIQSPPDGSEITRLDTLLTVGNAPDPEAEPVVYLFELDTVNTFDSPARQTSGALTEGSGVTSWLVSGLQDNTWYYWRVKASDGRAESAWQNGRFFVNRFNDAPGVPQLMNPGQLSWTGTLQPTLEVQAAIDIDGDVLHYEFEVSDADKHGNINNLIASGTSNELFWQVDTAFRESGWYHWRARAIDEHGLAGAWSDWVQFYADADGVNDPPRIRLKKPKYEHGDKRALHKLEKRYRKDHDDKHHDDHDDDDEDLRYIEIRWKDKDPDSNARISLYYDTDRYDEDGVLIVSGLFEDPDGKADRYRWDISNVPAGIYYIYAVIDDGNTRVTEYSRYALIVGDGGGWPFFLFDEVHAHHKAGKKKRVEIKWRDMDTDSNAMISLYYDTDNQGFDGRLIAAGLPEDPDGKADRYRWDASTLADGDYYVYAIISDEQRQYRTYMQYPISMGKHHKHEDDDHKNKRRKDKDRKDADDDSILELICEFIPFLCGKGK